MKEFIIEWETDYCEDYPEKQGFATVKAENEQEALKKFKSGSIYKIYKPLITAITERNIDNAK